MNAADSGPAWAAWSTITPVIAAPAARERYLRTALPFAISPGADGGYADLRVIDGDGREVPYALDPARAAAPPRPLAAIDAGYVERRWTQAVFDLGRGGAEVDTIRLTIDAARRPTYLERVAIDASDDRATWRVTRDDAMVYRVASDGGRGDQTVTFPPTRSRWLRVRVLDRSGAFPIDGATVEGSERGETGLVTVPVVAQSAAASAPHLQTWTFDARTAIRPSAVSFADRGGTYARHATVESSDDGTTWTDAGDADIAFFGDDASQTSFAFGERTARYWRVTVENGNDAPVAGLRPALLARRHDAVFAALPGRTYRLLSGNASATAPSYDLGARLAHAGWRAQRAAAGAGIQNVAFRDARPVTDRFPWLVSAALGAVAVMLGAVALRTVRSAGTQA